MDDGYDWDIYELFKEQIEQQLPSIESNILLLNKQDSVLDAIDDLFRTFHTYKPTSEYLRLTPMYKLVSKTETVLATLRDEKKIVQDSVIEWLLEVKDQLNTWHYEMQTSETEFSKPSKNLETKMRISKSSKSIQEILKKLNILYLDCNEKRVGKISAFLSKLVKNVVSSSNEEESKSLLKSKKYDLVMLNFDKHNYDFIHLIKEINKNMPILVVFDKISVLTQKRLIKEGINHTLTNPLNGKDIQTELKFLTKNFFSVNNIIVDNKIISEFIETLKPLPNTIFQIMQICDDDDVPVKDLVKVVKQDPIISANILKTASSPLYGTCEMKTIDQAIFRLGKANINALALSGIYKDMCEINLSPYNINEDVFSKVSMMRLSLMIRWYCKVSISDLSILSSSALLGNIGQLLIANELIRLDLVDDFKELCNSFDIKYAEEKILHTSTTIISSQILNYWKLPSEIVNIIAYSDNPNEAPTELKKLIVANNIVYKLVPLDGKILQNIPDDIFVIMAENNLDTSPLLKALEHINSVI